MHVQDTSTVIDNLLSETNQNAWQQLEQVQEAFV